MTFNLIRRGSWEDPPQNSFTIICEQITCFCLIFFCTQRINIFATDAKQKSQRCIPNWHSGPEVSLYSKSFLHQRILSKGFVKTKIDGLKRWCFDHNWQIYFAIYHSQWLKTQFKKRRSNLLVKQHAPSRYRVDRRRWLTKRKHEINVSV